MRATDNNYLLTGKVIEILNHSGLRFIKILCNPESILLEIEDEDHLNLGDKVNINSTIKVNSVQEISQTK